MRRLVRMRRVRTRTNAMLNFRQESLPGRRLHLSAADSRTDRDLALLMWSLRDTFLNWNPAAEFLPSNRVRIAASLYKPLP